jgi:hypothetical protein
METILINDHDRVINIYLESRIDPNGSFILPYQNETSDRINQIENIVNNITLTPQVSIFGISDQNYATNDINISTYDEVKAHFLPSPEKYFIEGVTDSKFSLLDLSYPKNVATKQQEQVSITKNLFYGAPSEPAKNIRVGKRIEISGTNVVGMILLESDARIEYVLYLDTPNPIFYVDNATGNTIFKYMRNNTDEKVSPGLSYYSDMVDEPKILSEVFIDRGTNNAFEPIRKLKNVRNLNELIKTGFGYYKINTRGYNFKDQ